MDIDIQNKFGKFQKIDLYDTYRNEMNILFRYGSLG